MTYYANDNEGKRNEGSDRSKAMSQKWFTSNCPAVIFFFKKKWINYILRWNFWLAVLGIQELTLFFVFCLFLSWSWNNCECSGFQKRCGFMAWHPYSKSTIILNNCFKMECYSLPFHQIHVGIFSRCSILSNTEEW